MLFNWKRQKPVWTVGSRVLAWREDGDHYSPGYVAAVDAEVCAVVFTDGVEASVPNDRLAPWSFSVGATVIGPPHPVVGEVRGVVQKAVGDMLYVEFDAGPSLWIGAWDVRLPRPGAAPASRRQLPGGPQPPMRLPPVGRESTPTDATATPSGLWAVGDRVLGRWFDLFWYPGTILAIETDGVRVLFDDGDQRSVQEAQLMALVVEVGDAAFARPKDHGILQYFAASLTRVDGEIVDLTFDEYDDGRQEFNSSISRLRFWKCPVGAGEFAFDEGDRVWAFDIDEFWYPAKITILNGDQVRVQFLDGPERLLTPERIKAFSLRSGDDVQVRFRGGPQYYPGKIARVQGDEVDVAYDDGDREKSLVALVRRRPTS